MSEVETPKPDPELDLLLERVVDVPPELVWRAWTTPELLVKWFTPKPWETVEAEVDLRPGGIFRTVMRSPEGETMPGGAGCYLEVIENRRLTWTSALEPGFRPAPAEEAGCGVGPFTAVITMLPEREGTRYTALALHRSSEERKAHEEMGFHDGWGTCLEQLVELMRAEG